MSIDYGSKRVGLAETDDLAMIASPLTVIHSSEIDDFLDSYTTKHQVDCIVVGWPLNLKGEDTNSTEAVRNLVTHLTRKFKQIEIATMDERLTSVIAKNTLIQGGYKKSKREDKANTDKISAAIILQSFLELRSARKFKN